MERFRSTLQNEIKTRSDLTCERRSDASENAFRTNFKHPFVKKNEILNETDGTNFYRFERFGKEKKAFRTSLLRLFYRIVSFSF